MRPSQVHRRTEIGARIRKLRLERKQRQTDLAAAAGISWRHLIRMERGEGGEPKRETLNRLADALGVTRSELTGEPDDDEEDSVLPGMTLDEFLRAHVNALVTESLHARAKAEA